MAQTARLVAPLPPLPPEEWPHHSLKQKPVPLHLIWSKDRRLEAGTYLSEGYGTRLSIEERAAGWQKLGTIAHVTQPNRLKGIQVDREVGTPFLAATQVYDVRPVPRKWLALERTSDVEGRYVKEGTILVTCSGSVGRTTLATKALDGVLISHDLLRIESKDTLYSGWLYAYLHSPQAKAMMTGAHYGHVIKHLEVAHLNDLPVPVVTPSVASGYNRSRVKILKLRNDALSLQEEAEAIFASSIGEVGVVHEVSSFEMQANSFGRRTRLDAAAHNPIQAKILSMFEAKGYQVDKLSELGVDIWVPNRYRRIPAKDGVDYYDSSNLVETNPLPSKRFVDCGFGDRFGGRVEKGWILIPSSGQVYGIIGQAVLAGETFDGEVLSNHVIRIAPSPRCKLRAGYLTTVLSHPDLGVPLLKSLPFGSSVPEIAIPDLSNVPIVRLGKKLECKIADLAEKAVHLRSKADILEREIAFSAGKLLDRFISGDVQNFAVTVPAISPEVESSSSGPMPEHACVRLLKGVRTAGIRKGAVGAIVHVYEDGDAYEVEFPDAKDGCEVQTLKASEIELI